MGKYMTDFINLAIQSGGWMILDRVYLRNRLESLIGKVDEDSSNSDEESPYISSQEILNKFLEFASDNQKIDLQNEEQVSTLKAELMELLTPPPSVTNALFSQLYDNSANEATDYFHLLNISNSYIKNDFIGSQVLEMQQSNWLVQPNNWISTEENSCQQCFESEGFGLKQNRIKRIIRMNLKGESWGFSYDPSPLFSEQCQFFPEEHVKLEYNRQLYETMLRLLDIYPHYFIAFDSKKDFTRDHSALFGGSTKLPLFSREANHEFDIPGFVTVSAALVDWPLSVIRLKTPSKKNLLNSIEYLNLRWQQYSYPSLDILAKDEKGNNNHSLIPFFRMEENNYIADLLLIDESTFFTRTADYENILSDKNSIVDRLGIINIKEELEINNRLKEMIEENILKQSVFKNTTEGETAFIRFVDTL